MALAPLFVLLAGCTAAPYAPETSAAATVPTAATPGAMGAGGPPPGPAASVNEVVAWIEAAAPADPANFNTVEEDGTIHKLNGSDVAFRLPGDVPNRTLTGCVSYHWSGAQFSCLGGIGNPPPRPPGIRGQWIGSWVDFDGKTVDIGSVHGDPGPFNNGNGKPLGYGARIKFGEYQCRSDPSGMYCVNYPHLSAIRLWGKPFAAYGCFKRSEPVHGIGEQFDCKQRH